MPKRLVLDEFLKADFVSRGAELYGARISELTDLPSGTVAPMLKQLADYGWLVWRWEKGTAEKLGRPRRKLYRLNKRKIPQVMAYVQPRR